jgi:membrane protease YdiL (CAAX protease family)
LTALYKAADCGLLGAPAVNPAYRHFIGNPVVLPGTISVAIVGAGCGEESVFRGFFFERGTKLLGRGFTATACMVLVSAAAFGGLHYFAQGVFGAEQATIFALVLGIIFAERRELWFLVVAHAAFDITTVLIIYFNAEYTVAHLLFH